MMRIELRSNSANADDLSHCRIFLAHGIGDKRHCLGLAISGRGFVAIAAGNTCVEHTTLQEGAIFIDLVAKLAIRKVKIVIEERHAVTIANRRARGDIRPDWSAPRVAMGASLNLTTCLARRTAHAVAGLCIERPGDVASLIQWIRQALGHLQITPARASCGNEGQVTVYLAAP
jgi:hypothetical protein